MSGIELSLSGLKKTALRLLEKINQNRRVIIKKQELWRKYEIAFRNLEQHWVAVDKKRLYTDQRLEQLSVLVELAAFTCAMHIILIYELELPPLEEYQFSHFFLAIWGLSCLTIICVSVIIAYLCPLIAIDLLRDSAREPPWPLSENELPSQPCSPIPQYAVDCDLKPEIVTVEQMHTQWRQKHEWRVSRMLDAFNYITPAFMFTLGFTVIAKCSVPSAAGWSGFIAALLSIMAWWRWQHPRVRHLLSATIQSNIDMDRHSLSSLHAERRDRNLAPYPRSRMQSSEELSCLSSGAPLLPPPLPRQLSSPEDCSGGTDEEEERDSDSSLSAPPLARPTGTC